MLPATGAAGNPQKYTDTQRGAETTGYAALSRSGGGRGGPVG
jgi:hypothetical protein